MKERKEQLIVTITDVPGVLPARALLNEPAVESRPPVVAAATGVG
jgi:transcription-repair coupling factor (superfamily II helicase)